MGVNYVKTMFERHIETHRKTADGEVNVLDDVSRERLYFETDVVQPGWFRSRGFFKEINHRHTIDLNTVDDFGSRFTWLSHRYHDDVIARRHESVTFVPDSSIARKIVLHEHQDSTSRYLHN